MESRRVVRRQPSCVDARNRIAAIVCGCPYCAGRKVLAGFNDLATIHPDIAAMWHPHMNGALKPIDVMPISGKQAWWQGPCGHVCKMAVKNRLTDRPGYCPYYSGRKKPERPIRPG